MCIDGAYRQEDPLREECNSKDLYQDRLLTLLLSTENVTGNSTNPSSSSTPRRKAKHKVVDDWTRALLQACSSSDSVHQD